jgi:excisionase family DNA binding protein
MRIFSVSESLLTAAELADLLGFAAGTIVDWAEDGKVPAFKIGGRLRFRESEVLAWLEAQRLGNGRGRSASNAIPLPGGVVYEAPATQEDSHAS